MTTLKILFSKEALKLRGYYMGFMKLHLKKFDEFLGLLITKEDRAITKEEMERISLYKDKIACQRGFTIEECKDFRSLIEKIRKELPQDKRRDFDWVAPSLLSFASAPIIDDLVLKKHTLNFAKMQEIR